MRFDCVYLNTSRDITPLAGFPLVVTKDNQGRWKVSWRKSGNKVVVIANEINKLNNSRFQKVGRFYLEN